MSTFEVYLGGARQQNSDYQMFPAATFQNTQAFNPAVIQRPTSFMLGRNLDFGNETALKKYMSGITFASGDKLGSIVIPSDFVAESVYWKVVTPVTGGQFSVAVRQLALSLVSATTTAAANSAWVAWPSAPHLFKTPDIVDITFDTVPVDGLDDLQLEVVIFGQWFRAGNY